MRDRRTRTRWPAFVRLDAGDTVVRRVECINRNHIVDLGPVIFDCIVR